MKNQNSEATFNVWNYKPWWCQPWSIILTGMIFMGISWLVWHTLWLTILVAVPIGAWWVYFLLIYPRTVEKIMNK